MLSETPLDKKWKPSIKTQLLHTTSDQVETCDYSLKDITKKGNDFMDVMYWSLTNDTNKKVRTTMKKNQLCLNISKRNKPTWIG